MVLYSYWQIRRDYKIKFTDKLKADLWTHLDLAKVHCLKGLTSLYIISYLHFLNLNNILTLPKVSSSQKLGLIRHNLCLTCLLPARFTCMHASLWKQMQAVYRNYHINLQWLNTGKKSCERMSFQVTWQKWYSSTGIFFGILSL